MRRCITRLRSGSAAMLVILPAIACLIFAGCGDDSVTDPPPPENTPQISSVSPLSGEIGDTITITGHRFGSTADSNLVAFGKAPANVVTASDSELVVTIPAGATSGPISLTAKGHTGNSPQVFSVRWSDTTYGSGAYVFNDICRTGSQFVAVGNSGAIMTSPDGFDWTFQTSPTVSHLQAVTVFERGGEIPETTLVAAGSNATIITSTDGIQWTLRHSIIDTGATIIDLAASEDNIIAIVTTGGYVLHSEDAVNWQSQSLNTSQDIFCGLRAEQFVLFSEGDSVFYSPDGLDWTGLITNLIAPAPKAAAWSGQRMIIVKPRSLLSRSSNTLFGDNTPSSALATQFSDIRWVGDRFLLTASTDTWNGLLSTVDGWPWKRHSSFGERTTTSASIACSEHVCIAVGSFGDRVMYWRKSD